MAPKKDAQKQQEKKPEKKPEEKLAQDAALGDGAAAAAAKGARATNGDGMTPAAVSSMLGSLKYKSDRGKDGELRAAASEALAIYRDLNANEKKKFLAEFEANGKGKKASNLKFALSYKRTFQVSESTEQKTVEGYFTKPQIAAFHGLAWSSYEPPCINQIVEQILADNKAEYDHCMPDKPHPKVRLLDLFWYIHSPGLTKSKKLRVSEETETAASDSKSAMAAAAGGVASSSGEGAPKIKEENPAWAKHTEKLKALRAVVPAVQKQQQVMSQLQVRLTVAGRRDESLRTAADAFKAKCGHIQAFLEEVLVLVAESELHEESAENLMEAANKLEETLHTSAVHLAAAREAVKKTTALLS